LANIGLGMLYLTFCLSEFFLSPWIFSLFEAKNRKWLLFICALTFATMMLAYSNVAVCIIYESVIDNFICT
jgi:hypothetical protein